MQGGSGAGPLHPAASDVIRLVVMERVHLPLRAAGLEVAAAQSRDDLLLAGVVCRLGELIVVVFFAASFTAGSRAAYAKVALPRPIFRRISVTA